MVSIRDLRMFLLAALVMTPLFISIKPTVAELGLAMTYALVLAIIGVSAIYVLLNGKVKAPRALGWSGFFFVSLITWSLVRATWSGLSMSLSWAGLFTFFCAVAIWPLSPREVNRLIWTGGIATLLAVSLSIFGGEGVTRVAWFVYPNFVGALLVLYSFFVLLGLGSTKMPTRLFSGIALTVLLVGLWWSSSRASMVAMLIVVVVLTLRYFYLKRNAFLWLAYIAVVMLGLSFIALPIVLPPQALAQLGFEGSLSSQTLDTYSLQLTGKSIYTGRGEMWAQLSEYIEQRPLVGWGTGVTPEDLTGNSLSAHNGYMQIWLQLGIFGLVLQLALLVALLVWLFKRRNRVSRIALAVLLGMMVHEIWEVTLIQNNTVLTILTWLVIGIGVSALDVADQIPYTVPVRRGRKARVEVGR
jgi:O-antigen ligase